MKYPRSACIITVSVLFLAAGFAGSSDDANFSTVKRHSNNVYASGVDAQSELSSVLVGSGIEGAFSPSPALTRSGGTIHWVKIRDRIDDRGMRHVFYRQRYLPPASLVDAESSAAEGVWMVGAELGLHYDAQGELRFVFGTQFEDVEVTNSPVIGSAAEARAAALDSPSFTPRNPENITLEAIDSQLSRSELFLHSTGNGNSFDYVWETPVSDTSGTEWIATVDAESGELTKLEDRTPWSVCSPNSNDQDSAVGVAQNSSISNRSVWATETDDRGVTYTHEAHKVSSGTNPDIQVFYGVENDPCGDSDTQDYSLMPIKTIGGNPKYDDYTSPDNVPGQAGSDAIFFTYKTMATFDAYGWDSWDDSGGDAKIVVNAICPLYKEDNAMFAYSQAYDYVPRYGVAVCEKLHRDFSPAAAIDVVAHEWGHGVVFSSAGYAYSGDGMTYHEGFADIIGHAVEWYNQASGSAAERAEWKFAEDRDDDQGTWRRRPDVDDGSGGHSYHADDPPGVSSDPYQKGLRLSVAQYLMSEGGYNPVCDRLDELDGCDVNVNSIGTTMANRILFKMLTDYATSSSDWDDFGELGKEAAFALYNGCPLKNAPSQQGSVAKAFEAIGYPPTYPFLVPCP